MTTLLGLLLLLQGIPVQPNQGGSVSGIVSSGGKAAAGVRVGAMAQPDSLNDLASASALASIAETDENGRYRLENIPPGRYYITAGRLDFPTYYPGTQTLTSGTVIAITPGANVVGINFAMADSSVRTPGLDFLAGAAMSFTIPLQVSVEGGGQLPVFSPRGFATLRLAKTANDIKDLPLNAPAIPLSSSIGEYRVSVENLAEGYLVKSIRAGATDLKTATLKLFPSDFPLLAQAQGLPFASLTSAPITATTTVSVTLTAMPAAAKATGGVRVTGKAKTAQRRAIYLSGMPGIFYSDGTFEFRGVPPGRHIVATLQNPESVHPLGALLVVGDRDIEGIELEEVRLLPTAIRSPLPPAPVEAVAALPPGSSIPLASLRVAIVDESTREPAGPGTVYITGPNGTSFDLPPDGRFEIPRLLPGQYDFEIQAFRHTTITRTIEIGTEDVNLELPVP